MKKLKELLLIPVIFFLVWGAVKIYRIPGQSNGSMAPDFVGYMANGDSLRLSDFEGQLVLLDFWGSWCGPCREHNKELVPLYKKYQGIKFENETAFTVISVGIETNKSRWLAAIKKDGLEWPNHISDIKRLEDHVALAYGIKEIPNTFLIDGTGKIIGVNLRVEKINDILANRRQK